MGIEPDVSRVCWSDCDPLVIPVLRVIASVSGVVGVPCRTTLAKRAALGTGHECPGHAAVGGDPGAELAASGVATSAAAGPAAVVVPLDGANLRVDDIGIAR